MRLVVLGESWSLQFVFLERFKVQGGDVVEHQAKGFLQFIAGCPECSAFDGAPVIQELGQQSIERALGITHIEVTLQQFKRAPLGCGFNDPHERQIQIKTRQRTQTAAAGASQQRFPGKLVRYPDKPDMR